MVFDEKLWNGGASEGEADELWEKREEKKKKGKRGSGYDGRSQGYMMEGSRASYKSDRRSHVNDGLDRRRTVVGEVTGQLLKFEVLGYEPRIRMKFCASGPQTIPILLGQTRVCYSPGS